MLKSTCKRRSSLRRVGTVDKNKDEGVEGDEVNAATNRNSMIKRRISFSGKKFVREFNDTEKPHQWDNSYELSDHTNGEESGAGAKTAVNVVSTQDKENVSPTSFHVDSTYNLQTSIDVTLLPNELKRRAGTGAAISDCPAESSRVSLTNSLFLSPAKREQIKDHLTKYPLLDKTVDLFPDIMRPSQKQKDQTLEPAPISKDTLVATPKPLTITSSVPPTDTSLLSNLPEQRADVLMSKVQKKTNIWDTSMDISFDMQISKKNEMGLDSIYSSPVIPMDMISIQGVSGPMSLRQLNEAINAGNIRVCPDGPKTPTTDRKAKSKKFWKGAQQENVEHGTRGESIAKLTSRTALKFNESIISPPAPFPDRPIAEDKRKYRYSQADEILLDNTNFLAHARLGDESQSQNNTRHEELTYMTSNCSKLELGNPSDFGESLAHKVSRFETNMPEHLQGHKIQSLSSNHRQTLLMEESMEQADLMSSFRGLQLKSNCGLSLHESQTEHMEHLKDKHQELRQSSIVEQPKVNQIPPRKSLYLNESIEEEDMGVRDDFVSESLPIYPLSAHSKSKARNTMLLGEPIEQDVAISGKLSPSVPIANHARSKGRGTLLMSEAITEDSVATRKDWSTIPITENFKSKTRNTLLLTEPIEEDIITPNENNPKVQLPNHNRTKPRSTLLMAEDIEEDIDVPRKDLSLASTSKNFKCKGRSTLLLGEPIEQDVAISEKLSPAGPLANHARSKGRNTLLMSEPIEDDIEAVNDFKTIPITENLKSKTRNTLLLTEPIEEDLIKPIENNPEVPLPKYNRSKPRSTLLIAEDIEEDLDVAREDFPRAPLWEGFKSKARSTLLLEEPIEQDVPISGKLSLAGPVASHKKSQARSTLHMAEPIGDDVEASTAIENLTSKTRNISLRIEPVEDLIVPSKDDTEVPLSKHKRSKPRSTLLMVEDIEEDIVAPRKDFSRAPSCEVFKSKPRSTILLAEPIEQDESISGKLSPSGPVADNKKFKARSTLHMSEPMEEDIGVSHVNVPTIPPTESLKYKTRNTLLQLEAMEEDLMAPNKNLSEISFKKHKRSKSRNTLIMTENIEEDNLSVNPIDIVEMASESVILPMEPRIQIRSREKDTAYTMEVSRIEEDLPKGSLSTQQTNSKARHTLLLAEKIEEDESVFTLKELSGLQPIDYDETINRNVSEFDRQGNKSSIPIEDAVVSRQNLKSFSSTGQEKCSTKMSETVSEIIKEEDPSKKEEKLKNFRRIPSMKEIVQQQHVIDSDHVATPQNKAKRVCKDIAMTPFRSPIGLNAYQSLIEFEDEETALKSPKQVLPDNGTPLARVKRSHKQLTPNLPQSKKHHGLFHDHIKTTIQENEFDVDETVQVLRDVRRSRSHCKDKPSSIGIFEDKCITISDVSNYFETQRNQEYRQEIDDSKKEEQQQQQQSRMQPQNESLELEIVGDGIQTYSKFINITSDTIVIPLMDESSDQEIDDVRLSLVSNLIEEDVNKNGADVIDLQCDTQLGVSTKVLPDKGVCLDVTLDPPVEAGTGSSCRKCKNCRRSLSNTTNISNGSFVLSPLKKWDIVRDLERLELVRQRPHFMEIQKHFYLKEQQVRHSLAVEDGEGSPTPDHTQLEEFRFNPVIKCSEMMQLFQTLPQRSKLQEEPVHCEEILQELDVRLRKEQPQWIFDHQLRVSRKLLFTHREFSQIFRIVMSYDSLDDTDMVTRISSIYTEPTSPPTNWLPFDHVLNYQLNLKLPLKLLDCLEGHNVESVSKFLQLINKICVDIKNRVRQMANAISSSISTLIRQQHRTVVKKTSYIINPIGADGILHIQEIDFVVEITNLEEICYKDIVQPQLYMFDEKIQYLPKGVAFLEAFLSNPEQYLKQTCNQ